MYSVVLMMALTGSADTPAWGNRGGCQGDCYGGGGCQGAGACYGGGGCHGKRGGLFGGCRGGGGLFRKGHGCHGGCNGGSCHGYSAGCMGGAHNGSCMGAGAGCVGGAAPPATGPGPEKVKAPNPEKGSVAPAPAKILVSLPAEAKLTVDGAPTTSTSTTRLFVSPALEQGKEYFYTLQAELSRDGTPVSVSKRIAVHAGEETRVSFELPTATNVAVK